MLAYIVKRVLLMVPTLLGALTITFVVVQFVPGGPVEQIMADGFDAVTMGRALIHDARLVQRFADGSTRVSGCTACNRCVVSMYTPAGTHCVIGPAPDASLNAMPAV